MYTKWIEVVPVDWTLESQGEYYFAQSGNTWTSNNQGMSNTSATATWTVTLENDVYVYIPWSVSSETSCDRLNISIDGFDYESYSGENSGIIETTLTAGTHTLTATYSKDGSVDNGSDCATITFNANEKPEEVTGKPFTISFNGQQYCAGSFATADDWASIEIKFAEVPPTEEVQFCLTSDAVQKEESWGTAYFSRYPQVAEVVTIDLDDWINN